ncbi:signal transduction histidine kinase [Herbihabitans rhizosphaerae]|uniref:histidine kinase n=1 Tax=Herbihabitans rhizosphaerae TaxID=1872711 RepID=A0A4Q7KCY0_9PSEU|nr:histidine kinase [Herbihabitans rhizosphaerae]RZS29788.1 signal transduction histidine kinase [Herbihabitans rhizosphaerae]
MATRDRRSLSLAKVMDVARRHPLVMDAVALLVAVADVWLVIPSKATTYSVWLSGIACAAMLIRRRFPFIAVLITIPGYLAGWAALAAVIALGTLARRKLLGWQTMVGAALVFMAKYVLWPLPDFFAIGWREHILRVIYGIIFAAMPVAVGLLAHARQELSDRITELAASRERENRLHAEAIRGAERARLAREMHDVVSHQVTLIAMQAGALQVTRNPDESREVAQTIRDLSSRTLVELRELVGVLRSGSYDDAAQPGLEEVGELIREADVPIKLAVDTATEQLPPPVSRAAYRTIQEALTNVRKHASGAPATVRVHTEGDALTVEVHNGPSADHACTLPSGGHGLMGLRERAGLLGGTFHAGPTREGGFRVRARYPLAV